MTGFKNYHMKYEHLMGLVSKLSEVVYIEFRSLSKWENDQCLQGYYLSEYAHTHTHTHNKPGGQKMCIININLCFLNEAHFPVFNQKVYSEW